MLRCDVCVCFYVNGEEVKEQIFFVFDVIIRLENQDVQNFLQMGKYVKVCVKLCSCAIYLSDFSVLFVTCIF